VGSGSLSHSSRAQGMGSWGKAVDIKGLWRCKMKMGGGAGGAQETKYMDRAEESGQDEDKQ
jgi:hypothetical protein